jgi:Leucine-rich repeat (LRR) protein
MRSKKCLELRLKDSIGLDLDLSGQGLTRIYYKERLCTFQKIDFSKNKLKNVDTLLPYLIDSRKLNFDENLIESVEGFDQNASLEEISIRKTPLAQNLSAVQQLRSRYPCLKIIPE